MTFVSVGSPSEDLVEQLLNEGTEWLDKISPDQIKDSTKVFVNGAWIGITNDPSDLVWNMKEKRWRLEVLTKEISIVRDFINKEIWFYTDSGWV